ncbi:hypothetical protein [Tumebacillus lipolyticus]|uniref:Sigma-70 family RNA polymerase sigma factor n=1 Tax=Tumebacillus lipolyticus TaxID=1280370 RepID=A0ABW4ZSJ0_9BACL
MTDVNSAAVTATALAAYRELFAGRDDQFVRLVELLRSHRHRFIAKFSIKMPSLDRSDLESTYMEALWIEVKRYRSAEKGAFLMLLNRAITLRAHDLGRRTIRVSKREESLDWRIAQLGETSLPTVRSEEDSLLLRETIEEHLRRTAYLSGEMSADQRALLRTQLEQGLSLHEAVNLAPDIYRNRQQMWRATKHRRALFSQRGR